MDRRRLTLPSDPCALAYLAGVVDSDGNVSVCLLRRDAAGLPYHHLMVQITNTDERLMEWLLETFGGGVSVNKPRAGHEGWKRAYGWTVYGQEAVDLLRAILPWMVVKKERAELAANFPVGGYGTRITPEVRESRTAL